MAHTLRRPLSILCKNAAIRRCAAPSVTMATVNHRVESIVSMSRFPRQPLLQSRFYRIQGQHPLPKVKPTKAQVEERVLKAVKTFDRLPQDKPLLLDTHFMNDLGLDSLDHVEIVMAVEQEFGLEIPDESAEKLVTPKLLIEYVCKEEQVSQ